jgi:8-oxo-dGTP diphosphatase
LSRMPVQPVEVRVRVAGIVLQQESILLVKHRKGDHAYWMLPGGGVDPGETLHEALIREFWEETRVNIEVGDLVLVNDSIAPDHSRHVVNLHFLANIRSGVPGRGDDARICEVGYLPVERLPEAPMRPDFGEALLALIRAGFPGRAPYLGCLWRDE